MRLHNWYVDGNTFICQNVGVDICIGDGYADVYVDEEYVSSHNSFEEAFIEAEKHIKSVSLDD